MHADDSTTRNCVYTPGMQVEPRVEGGRVRRLLRQLGPAEVRHLVQTQVCSGQQHCDQVMEGL